MTAMARHSASVPQAHLGMLLWALIVGLSFPAVGLLSEGLPPLLLTSLRFAIAALAILPLAWGAPDRMPSIAGLLLYAVMGLCLAGFFGGMFWAAHRTTALAMAVIYVTVPLMAFGMGRVIGVEPRAGRLLGILMVGALGALALAFAESGGRLDQVRFGSSEAVYFLGCVSSALYPVLSKLGLARGWLSGDAALRTLWSLIAGGLLIGLLGLAFEPTPALLRMTAGDLALVAYLGVFSSSVTFWLTQRATAVLTPGTVTAYTYFIPFVSMVLLFVAEPARLSWVWLPGIALVVLAIALLFMRDVRIRVAR